MADLDEHQSEGALDAAMTETIRSKLAEISERPDDDGDAAADAGANLGDDAAPAAQPAAGPLDKPRDETGKFTKASAPQPDSVPASQGEESPPADGAEPEQPLVSTTGQPLDITRPPSSWKPAAKALWAQLPEAVRAEAYRRENDFLHGNKDLRETADFGKSIKQIMDPYRMLIEAENGTPERAIADTMRTAALFRVGTPQQKLDALFQIDKQFNAGLTQFIQSEFTRLSAQQQGEPGQSPVAAPQQPFVDPRVDQIMASLQAQERAQTAQAEQASNRAVEEFMAEKGADGQQLYPFVDNVIDDMSHRVALLRRQNPAMGHKEALKQAYEAAVWANPETRAVLISQQQAQAAAPGANLLKVQQAQRASATNVPRRGAIPPASASTHLTLGTPESDDSIRETYRQLQANN